MENTIKTYVLKNFYLNYSGVEDSVAISYGREVKQKVHVPLLFGDYFSQAVDEFPPITWTTWNGTRIPLLFAGEGDYEVWDVNAGGEVEFKFDVFSAIFYLLSGWQENVSEKKDRFNRFPFESSFQCAYDLAEIPVVNYYYDMLHAAIEQGYGKKLKRRLEKFRFVTFVSHDIDKCQSGWLEGGLSEIRRGKLFSALKLIWRRVFEKDIWFNFQNILDFHAEYGIKPTFFFLPRQGRDVESGITNADYSLKAILKHGVFGKIVNSGGEIGVHGSPGSSQNVAVLSEDIDLLNQDIIGNRFHFLLFDVRKTPHVLTETNIVYDNTLGFAEHIGFRNSTCTPFYLYDFTEKWCSDVIEIPLTIMDRTLSQEKYMGIDRDDVWRVCKDMVEEIINFNGVLSILWHNHHFSDYKFIGWRDQFEKIITETKKRGTVFLSGKGIIREVSQ